MVVKMIKWRPWQPSFLTNKYEVKLVVKRLEGFSLSRPNNNINNNNQVCEGASDGVGGDQQHESRHHNQKVGTSSNPEQSRCSGGLTVEIRWKGPKFLFSSVSRKKRDYTKEAVEEDGNGGVFTWDEEFQTVCDLSAYKDNNVFLPWEIILTLLNGTKPGLKNKVPAIGTASINLAEYASRTDEKEFQLSIPLTMSSAGVSADPPPSLCISLSLVELRTVQDPVPSLQRSIIPVPQPSQSGEAPPAEKDELSTLKASLRKVKILKEYVSTRRAKKACREEEGSSEGGKYSARSEDGDCTFRFDSDSLEEFDGEGEIDEDKVDASIRKSFSYGTLAYANYAGVSFFSSARIDGGGDEDWVYYSNRISDVGCSVAEESSVSSAEPQLVQSSKRSILPWRKRKLSFRSPKAKGEPLLKKAYAEEGGDDIDYDRRQLSSDEALTIGWHKSDEDSSSAHRSSVSEFGDDSFAVGSWEHKEIMSRDGHMKLYSQVFFASIDQRSERAAGEGACTALVAVIADWFQNNADLMPNKSQFDSLIREGSLKWRNLCEIETYREKFPDKHFDLETILQSKIRPLSVNPDKSFIGFFHPDGTEEGKFDFLHEAMSFDTMWDEITCAAGSVSTRNGEPQVYIVSWNDHFFILKVEAEAYYIVDTLGERLFEGCNQAYILKFDRDTRICKLPAVLEEGKPAADQPAVEGAVAGPTDTQASDETKGSEEEEVICQGKECCKEYIKSFLAAIPIREMLVDLKKGLLASTPLHHRLQIELHYTQAVPVTSAGSVSIESVVTGTMQNMEDVVVTEVAVV